VESKTTVDATSQSTKCVAGWAVGARAMKPKNTTMCGVWALPATIIFASLNSELGTVNISFGTLHAV
jgi:hypothetical protein